MKTIRPRLRRLTLALILCGVWLTLSACDSGESVPAPTVEATTSKAGSGDENTVVAKIGDESITDGELRNEVQSELKRVESQIYRIKRKGLDELIEQKLLEQEARAQNLTVDELVAKEVQTKIEEVTEDDAKKFYEENKGRMRGEFDALKPRIIQFLGERSRTEKQQAYVKDLKAKSKVAILLEPPKVNVEIGNAPVWGNADAPVTIVEFSDYECPYCRRSQATLTSIKEKYKDKIKVVFKDFPLPFHRKAVPAAEASRCAAEQGKFWEYHDKLFSGGGLDEDNFKRYAEELSLDGDKFKECLAADRHEDAIKADHAQGQAVGVSGTPAFFINGRLLSGAQPVEAFSEIIDDELEKAGPS